MKSILNQTMAVCAALALTAGIAAAQTDNGNNKPSATDKKPSGQLVRGSNVTGAKLFDQHGKNIGQIDDVLFDENSGGMTHAIVSVGGWLGIGDKESAVPWKFVRQSKDHKTEFVLQVDQSKLREAESYDRNNWPQPDQQWYQRNYAHFGLTPTKNAKLVRASTVIGSDLFDQHGNKIGKINDVLMHPNSGRVAYATLDIGNYVGKGDKLTNVPWPLVRQSKKDTAGFVVNADKAKLSGATYFDRNNWPDYTDWGVQANTYGYYGYEPYWTHPIWP